MTILEDNAAVRVLGKMGEERGIEKGRKQGEEAKAKETAIKMLKEGFNLDIISRVLEMPISWIEEISKSNRI